MLGYRDSGHARQPGQLRSRAASRRPRSTRRWGAWWRSFAGPAPRSSSPTRRTRRATRIPDHLRVNEISELAFDAAGDPDRYPEAGPAWQPLAALLRAVVGASACGPCTRSTWSWARVALRQTSAWPACSRPSRAAARSATDSPHRVIDRHQRVRPVTREALLAHATQVDPTSRHWFGLPTEVADELYPYDEYEVVRDLTGRRTRRDDLFAGSGRRPRPVNEEAVAGGRLAE